MPRSALHDHDPRTPAAVHLLPMDGPMSFITGMVLGIVLGVAGMLGLFWLMADRDAR